MTQYEKLMLVMMAEQVRLLRELVASTDPNGITERRRVRESDEYQQKLESIAGENQYIAPQVRRLIGEV